MSNFQEMPPPLTFCLYLLHEEPSCNSHPAAIPKLCFYWSLLLFFTPLWFKPMHLRGKLRCPTFILSTGNCLHLLQCRQHKFCRVLILWQIVQTAAVYGTPSSAHSALLMVLSGAKIWLIIIFYFYNAVCAWSLWHAVFLSFIHLWPHCLNACSI